MQLERWDAVTDVTMVGLPPGLPWPWIEDTIRAAAPGPPAGRRRIGGPRDDQRVRTIAG